MASPLIDPIYEDNHLLVLNKPADILTQPNGTENMSLEALAKDWLKIKYQKPGNIYLHAIHRLDKSASGIVVLSKTSKALRRLNESVRKNLTGKFYYAIVEGKPLEEEGFLAHYLVHDAYHAKIAPAADPGAKFSRLHFRSIKRAEEFAILEIKLETGRYHQIRVQLSATGCPILGDAKYGSSQSFGKGIALHHYRFEIPHPISREPICLTAPPPDFWGGYLQTPL